MLSTVKSDFAEAIYLHIFAGTDAQQVFKLIVNVNVFFYLC